MDTSPFELYERYLVLLSMETLMLMKEEDEERITKVLTSKSFWKHKVAAILGYSIEMDFETPGYEVWKDIYNSLDMNDLNKSFRIASDKGHTEVVALLLNDERVDPSTFNNFAIGVASEYGHTKVVSLLLKDERVDPSDQNNFAIKVASNYKHKEIVALLLQDTRVSSTYKK